MCDHEDTTLMCPFGCGETVDSDTRVCSGCREGVDPMRVCLYCDEELGTLGEYEQAEYEQKECSRTIPPHFPSMVLTENGERCVECGGYGKVMEPHPLNDLTAPTYTDCPKGCASKVSA